MPGRAQAAVVLCNPNLHKNLTELCSSLEQTPSSSLSTPSFLTPGPALLPSCPAWSPWFVDMKLSLYLLALVPVAALAAPLEPRQGGVAVNCGGTSYTSSQVNRAINNGLSGQYSSSGYPHAYQ